jgi:hypothetical protein
VPKDGLHRIRLWSQRMSVTLIGRADDLTDIRFEPMRLS